MDSPQHHPASNPQPAPEQTPSEPDQQSAPPQAGAEERRDQGQQNRYRNQRGQRSQGRGRQEQGRQRGEHQQRESRQEASPDRPDRERSERSDRPDREQRAEQRERPERDRSERDRPERGERSEQQQHRQDQGRGDRGRQQQGGERDRGRQGGGRAQERDSDRSSLAGSEISVVVPLYNEEQSLRELHDRLRNVLGRHGHYEIIFIDDGSTDGSQRVLQELRNKDRRIKIIRFRRNFGKSAALAVGFQHAKGDVVITMDSDLQDDPAEIPNLVNEIKKGYDLVSGWKKKRHDPLSKTIPSKFFNFVTSVMTGIKLHDFNCGLKAYRRDVVKDVKIYGELHRYIPVLAHWRGFKVGEIAVQHHARKYGKTKFGIGRFWKGFLDLLGVLFTTRYMQRPLHLFGFWGMVAFLLGFGIDAYLVVQKLFFGEPLGNRPLFLGGILLIIVGIQLISIGLIGELITKARQDHESTDYSIREVWK